MNDDEKEYIEFRFYLIGDYEIGKQSFINRLIKIPCTKTIPYEVNEEKKQKKIVIQYDDKKKEQKLNTDKFSTNSVKIIENNNEEIIKNHALFNPSKLYNINNYKIIFRPFYVIPAEDLPYDYFPVDEEDDDFEIERQHKILLKNTKKDLTKKLIIQETIIPDKYLKGYKINVENLFIFMFDLSSYSTFEKLIYYYKSISTAFHLGQEDSNISSVLIGNKLDKKKKLKNEEIENFNLFLSKTKMEYFECSTKPFFNFEKLIKDIFFSIYGNHRENFKSDEFKNKFNMIISIKPNFPRSERNSMFIENDFPGPNFYSNNIYDLNSINDIKKALIDKKLRFKSKIFVNKLGPVFKRSKSVMKFKNDEFENKDIYINLKDMKDCVDKPPVGYSLGVTPGKLNLKKLRSKLINERFNILNNSFDENVTKLFIKKEKSVHDKQYFEDASERKSNFHQNLKNEMMIKRNNILKIHNECLNKLEKENQMKKENIFSNRSLLYSNSTPDILTLNPLDIEKKLYDEKQRQKQRERIYQVIYSNNQKHISKQNEMKEKIIRNIISPSPNSYNINRSLINSNQGAIFLGKRKELTKNILDPPFSNLKSSFDKFSEKISNIKLSYSERFKEKEFDDRNTKEYKDKKIWEKWEKKKKKSDKKILIDNLVSEREIKSLMNKKMKEKRKEELEQLRKDILKREGASQEFKEINYSLVEEQSPKYSMGGKNKEKKTIDENEMFLKIGGDTDYIKVKKRINEPNFNFIKPSLPSFSFCKSSRFINKIYEYDNNILFADQKFIPDDKENFSSKEPFNSLEQRTCFVRNNNNFPGPGEYKIKSSFDEIIFKNKKFENRKNILKDENIS